MTKPEDAYPMSPQRRELFMRILNDEIDIHPITMRLHFLADHFPPEQIDSALKWLISNNLIGKRFVAWFTYVCKGSDLELHRLLLAVLANSKLAPVVAGRNFKL
jgi:hypothetical protein